MALSEIHCRQSCRLGLQNTYSALPSRFYARVAPAPAKDPRLVVLNSRLAEELGFDPAVLEHEAAAVVFRQSNARRC
jgi:uncharacterized protein YdiU (UPF0061 family)